MLNRIIDRNGPGRLAGRWHADRSNRGRVADEWTSWNRDMVTIV